MRLVVFGSTSSIGSAVAKRFGRAGGTTVFVGRREPEAVDLVGNEYVSLADLRTSSLDAAFSSLEDIGEIDVALFAMGRFIGNVFIDADDDDIAGAIQDNLTSTILIAKRAIAAMQGRPSAAIVILSSIAAETAGPGLVVYGALKAAVSTFAKAVRQELGSNGPRIICFEPGLVDTAFARDHHSGAASTDSAMSASTLADLIFKIAWSEPNLCVDLVRPTSLGFWD